MESKAQSKTSGQFDRALRHLAGLSAIARLSDYKDAVQELILQTIAVADAFTIKDPAELREAIDIFFGIPLEQKDVNEAIEFLSGGDRVRRNFGAYALSDPEQKMRSAQVTLSRDLEVNIYLDWNRELTAAGVLRGLAFDQLEKCMRDYMSRAFRQHGIETAQILDASGDIGEIETESLVHVLNETVSKYYEDKSIGAHVRSLISLFFRNTDKYPERRKYLIELADGAYSFYTFFIDPESLARIHGALRKIEFYLDTNFLWSLLGLHENQYVDASVELFSVVKSNHLPFSFRFQKITEQELLRSVASSGAGLREMAWKASISATLKNSPYISGLERRFHEKNAVQSTDVEIYLKPYENISRVVQDQGIKIDNQEIDWGEGVNDLLHDFDEYLASIDKEKTYEAKQHDVRMLWLVRGKRSNAKSPLEAGTLFLTCDNRLYNFDVHNSRRRRTLPAAILPNVLLQILRPFIKATDDFDSLFAKTFSLPEFRSYSKKSSLALQKMAQILSAVDGLPEGVAEQTLMDDILVRDVSHAKDAVEIVAKMDAAIVVRLGGVEAELQITRAALDRLRVDAEFQARQAAEEAARGERAREGVASELVAERNRRLSIETEKERIQLGAEAARTTLSKTKMGLQLVLLAILGGALCFVSWHFRILEKPTLVILLYFTVFAAGTALIVRKTKDWCIAWLLTTAAFLAALLTAEWSSVSTAKVVEASGTQQHPQNGAADGQKPMQLDAQPKKN
jgi:hypothetical protein